MKNFLWKIAGLVLLGSGQVAAITLGIEPPSLNSGTGDMISLDLVASGLTPGGPDSVGGFDVDILYDQAVLGFAGGTTGVDLGFVVDGYSDLLGVIDGFAISLESEAFLDSIQGSTVVLATFDFDVLNLPLGSLTIVEVDQLDLFLSISDGAGINNLPVTGFSSVSINNPVAQVPAPSVLALFTIGLTAIGYRRKVAK